MSLNRRGFLGMGAAAATSLAAATEAWEAFAGPGKAPSTTKAGGVKTGGIRLIPIDGGKYKVWTKKVGAGRIKMLLLHGGPGFTHEYFECFEDFLPQEGIQFFYYDQLGSAYSDQPDDVSSFSIRYSGDETTLPGQPPTRASGPSTASARRSSRCARPWGWRTSICWGTPGAACSASSTP